MSQVISTRINDELYGSLVHIAEERERKVSEIVQEALNYYVDHCANYKLALERLNDPTDEIINGDDLLHRLKWGDE